MVSHVVKNLFFSGPDVLMTSVDTLIFIFSDPAFYGCIKKKKQVPALLLKHFFKEVTTHMWTNQLGIALDDAKTLMG